MKRSPNSPCSAVLLCVLAAAAGSVSAFQPDPAVFDSTPGAPVSRGFTDTVALAADDGTAETSVGDGGQFLWMNRFTPSPIDYPFVLERIEVVFGATNVAAGDPVELFLWSDTDGDGDPGTGTVLMTSFTATVQVADQATFNVYELPIPVRFTVPGDVLVGVVNRGGSEGFSDFPAALDTTSSNGISWAASWLAGDVPAVPTLPADEQWGTIDSFGLPGNWMVRASGRHLVEFPVPAMDAWSLFLMSVVLLVTAVAFMPRRRR